MMQAGQCCNPNNTVQPLPLKVVTKTKEDWEDLLQQSVDANSRKNLSALTIHPSPLQQSGSNSATAINWPTNDELFQLLQSPLATHLNKIVLTGCSCLTCLPSSITGLQHLDSLEICSCRSLTELSAGMGNLKKLKKLVVRACQKLDKLPADLCSAQQTELTEVDIDSCTYLTAVPACLGSVSSLKVLRLHGNTRLNHVPEELSRCQALQELDIRGCADLTPSMPPQRWASLGVADRLALVVDASNRYANIMKLTTKQDDMVASLERMSWLAVLLATATFIGFLQPPAGTLLTREYPVNSSQGVNQTREYAANSFQSVNQTSFTLVGLAPRLSPAVRAFLVLDTWSFLLALSCLVIIVVLSMPRLRSDTDKKEAGRFWILLVLAWGQLYLAVAAGCGAFVASALCVYDDMTAILVPAIIGSAILFTGACFILQRFATISPGIEAICMGVKETWYRDLPFHRIPGMNALVTAIFSCLTCLPCTYAKPTEEDWDTRGYRGPGCVQQCFLAWQYLFVRCGLLPEGYIEHLTRKWKQADDGCLACC